MIVSLCKISRLLVCGALILLCYGCITEITKNGKPYIKTDKVINKKDAAKDYAELAAGYLKQGNKEGALRSINKGLAINPDSPEIINILALYFESDGEYKLADNEFNKAISADKSYTATYMNYGGFLYRLEKFQQACDMLKKASSDVLYERRADAFNNLGLCLKKIDKIKEAEEAFNRSLGHDFRNPKALIELSLISFDRGDFIKSQQYYDEYLKYGAQSPRTLWLGIRLAHIADDQDKKSSYGLFLKNQFPDSKECGEYISWLKTR